MNMSYPTRSAAGIAVLPGRGEQEQIPPIRRYLRMLNRRKWVIAGTTFACIILGLVVTLLITPKYTAKTTLEISRESNNIAPVQGVERETGAADQEFYQTQYGLLRSRVLAERVATELKLVDDPKFYEMFGYTSQRPAFSVVGGRFTPGGRGDRLRVAGEVLLDHISVTPTRLSRLVDISFVSPDPIFSTRVVNAWTTNFIKVSLERRYQATSYARNFLETRLEQLRQRLETSERQLVGYASQQRLINLPAAQAAGGTQTVERSLVADDLASLNGALAQARATRIDAEAKLQQSGGGTAVEALRNDAINTLRARRAVVASDYQKLLVQFEPQYPAAQALKSQLDQIDRSIAREEQRVSGSIQGEYRQAVEREQLLEARVNGLKDSFLDQRRRAIQYNIYQREVDTNRQLYDGLLQRYKEIGIAGGVGINNVAVVDPADPPLKPSSPRLLLNLALALFAGLGLGAVIALLLEQADEAIADPDEMQRILGLPLLGAIPKLVDEEPRTAILDRKSSLVDAYLSVQANLQFTTEHGVPRSLAITSTRPAEGKSTTALALATVLARAQRRVVLVDGDMRSPSVHSLIGVSHENGLSNYLAGADLADTMLHHADKFGFAIMTSGPLPPNAAELLTSSRLQKLLGELLDRFDHVVIDSPPVMGLADAPLIASRVEGVIYAVESHGIRASLVATGINRLVSANAHIIGGVLTKFETRRSMSGYGYDYGYGYGRDDVHASGRLAG
ncbi:GumC family protein [uncultured Sphingomonas sp.]|uniref:GumC family protein n=1 Tax=uncultured Sphingomonas sp. TaxID=158754 RepID=UPI003749BAC3